MTFTRAMIEQKQGSIINISSESAIRPLTRVAGYGVAKAAVTILPNTCAANWPPNTATDCG